MRMRPAYYRQVHPLEALYRERLRRRASQVVHTRASWTAEGVVWKKDDYGVPQPHDATTGDRYSWAPQRGAQADFLACTDYETLISGGRGTGKSDSLLMAFAKYVDKGYGAHWKGILFRRTYPELNDIIGRSKRWFSALFPGARYNESTKTWRWPGGETLRFAHAARAQDYWSYHGQEYAFMAFEELTTWPSEDLYTDLMSLVRSSNPAVPRMVRAATNPFGVGNAWVKARFKMPIRVGNYHRIIEGEKGRSAFHSVLEENVVFLAADPSYKAGLDNTRDPNKRKAWKTGDWDIVSGGMFDDLWRDDMHVILPIRVEDIPFGWHVDRAYDHGTAAPFSTGFYAESNGTPMTVYWIDRDGVRHERMWGQVKGDLIRFGELYGWNGEPNQGLKMQSRAIAKKIIERMEELGIEDICRAGPADDAMWAGSQDDPKKSVASEMAAAGVEWVPAGKGPGSRANGWQLARDRLEGTIPDDDGYRDAPGFVVTTNCEHFLRLIPVAPRDADDLEDVDTEWEDHVADEWRYRCRAPKAKLSGRARARALARR